MTTYQPVRAATVTTAGMPIRMAEMLSDPGRPAPMPSGSASRISPSTCNKAKKAIKKAFQNQIERRGLHSFIEVLSTCPTNWGMTPQDAIRVDDA